MFDSIPFLPEFVQTHGTTIIYLAFLAVFGIKRGFAVNFDFGRSAGNSSEKSSKMTLLIGGVYSLTCLASTWFLIFRFFKHWYDDEKLYEDLVELNFKKKTASSNFTDPESENFINLQEREKLKFDMHSLVLTNFRHTKSAFYGQDTGVFIDAYIDVLKSPKLFFQSSQLLSLAAVLSVWLAEADFSFLVFGVFGAISASLSLLVFGKRFAVLDSVGSENFIKASKNSTNSGNTMPLWNLIFALIMLVAVNQMSFTVGDCINYKTDAASLLNRERCLQHFPGNPFDSTDMGFIDDFFNPGFSFWLFCLHSVIFLPFAVGFTRKYIVPKWREFDEFQPENQGWINTYVIKGPVMDRTFFYGSLGVCTLILHVLRRGNWSDDFLKKFQDARSLSFNFNATVNSNEQISTDASGSTFDNSEFIKSKKIVRDDFHWPETDAQKSIFLDLIFASILVYLVIFKDVATCGMCDYLQTIFTCRNSKNNSTSENSKTSSSSLFLDACGVLYLTLMAYIFYYCTPAFGLCLHLTLKSYCTFLNSDVGA